MKAKFLIIGVTLVASVALAAQSTLVFRDKGGNMSVTHFKTFNIGTKDGTYSFFAAGDNVRGSWEKKGMVITTKQMTGTASGGGQKGLDLKTARMSGGVHVQVNQPSTDKTSGKSQTLDLTSDSAVYTSADSKLDLLGGVKIVNIDEGDARTMTLTGSTATVVMNLNATSDEDRISTATLNGLVEFDLKAQRKTTDSKTKKVTIDPVFIKGHANRLTYSAANRTLELTGNVELDGSDPMFGSEMKGVERAVVTLDKKWNVINIELSGNQASSTIQRKGGKD